MLLDPEITVLKAEIVAVLCKHQRKNLFFIFVLFLRLIVPKYKHIFCDGVAVEVCVEVDFSAFKRPFHHVLYVIVYGESSCVGRHPLPIEICAHERAPVVPHYYAIRILHWHNLENVLVAKINRSFIVRDKEVNDSLEHPGGLSFSRVHSSSQNNSLAHG